MIPKDQKALKRKKARLYLNKIRNLTFKYQKLKVTREGRAEVGSFLHNFLPMSLHMDRCLRALIYLLRSLAEDFAYKKSIFTACFGT